MIRSSHLRTTSTWARVYTAVLAKACALLSRRTRTGDSLSCTSFNHLYFLRHDYAFGLANALRDCTNSSRSMTPSMNRWVCSSSAALSENPSKPTDARAYLTAATRQSRSAPDIVLDFSVACESISAMVVSRAFGNSILQGVGFFWCFVERTGKKVSRRNCLVFVAINRFSRLTAVLAAIRDGHFPKRLCLSGLSTLAGGSLRGRGYGPMALNTYPRAQRVGTPAASRGRVLARRAADRTNPLTRHPRCLWRNSACV